MAVGGDVIPYFLLKERTCRSRRRIVFGTYHGASVMIRRTSDWNRSAGGAYENLVVSSVGLKRFNLLGSSSSNRAGASSLGCVISLPRHLMMK
jgi:hypothetical protein